MSTQTTSTQRLLQILVPIIILILAFGIYKKLSNTKKPERSRPSKAVITQVITKEVYPNAYAPPMKSFGNVTRYDQTTLVAQVSGKIIEISESFRVGLPTKKGETLIKIDPLNFKADVDSARASVTIAQASLDQELILKKQSENDWVSSGRQLSTASPLVLRQPQVDSATANLLTAKASLKQAQQNLRNTSIKAPYDGLILSREISLGDVASTSTVLGSILYTGKVEIRLPLTASQSKQWNLYMEAHPNSAARLLITKPGLPDHHWLAEVRALAPETDSQNQVSYLIAEVKNPYNGKTPLTIGTFVNVEIPTLTLPKGTYRVEESALVNNNYIWSIDSNNKLKKQIVTRLRSFDNHVYLSLKKSGSEDAPEPLKIITRPLNTFKPGQVVSIKGKATKGQKTAKE